MTCPNCNGYVPASVHTNTELSSNSRGKRCHQWCDVHPRITISILSRKSASVNVWYELERVRVRVILKSHCKAVGDGSRNFEPSMNLKQHGMNSPYLSSTPSSTRCA
ncbi:hypothetical protein TNCV_4400991 [Trichonephila clavipes]|nr:hypothetical protein TNCV_4400991 [Trichonephila clavipes]